MADIFISYAREEREFARALAERFEIQGWSVWWDRQLLPGQDFNQRIQEQLDEAGCIVVVWSKVSVVSQYVRDEAADGQVGGRLVPVLLDDVQPPLGFRQLQTARLIGWPSREATEEFRVLIAAVEALLLRAAKAVADREAQEDQRQRADAEANRKAGEEHRRLAEAEAERKEVERQPVAAEAAAELVAHTPQGNFAPALTNQIWWRSMLPGAAVATGGVVVAVLLIFSSRQQRAAQQAQEMQQAQAVQKAQDSQSKQQLGPKPAGTVELADPKPSTVDSDKLPPFKDGAEQVLPISPTLSTSPIRVVSIQVPEDQGQSASRYFDLYLENPTKMPRLLTGLSLTPVKAWNTVGDFAEGHALYPSVKYAINYKFNFNQVRTYPLSPVFILPAGAAGAFRVWLSPKLPERYFNADGRKNLKAEPQPENNERFAWDDDVSFTFCLVDDRGGVLPIYSDDAENSSADELKDRLRMFCGY